MLRKKKCSAVGELASLVEREKENLVTERKWSLVEVKKGKTIGKQGRHLRGKAFNHQKPQLKKRVSTLPKTCRREVTKVTW